jgi:hypothetical protein
MRRLALLGGVLLGAALLSSGCGGGKTAKKTGVETDAKAVAAVKARADAALGRGHEPDSKPAAPAALPMRTGVEKPVDDLAKGQSDERSGRVLGKDIEGCTWVEGVASVVVGEQDTMHQARAMAIAQARAAAIQDFAGVDVKSKLLDFRQEGLRGESRLTENLLQTTRNGRILKEEVLEQGYRDAPDCPSCRYRARLKACVLPVPDAGDKDFHVGLSLNRVRFVHGDEARISITATRDCWVYLYDVYDLGKDAKTALIAPNELVRELKLKAGEEFVYPDEAAKKAGVSALHAELPEGATDVSAETIRVVATKTPLPLKVYDPTDGGWLGVLQRLNRSRADWAEDAEAFTIYKR